MAKKKKPGLLLSSALGEGQVPQDKNYNGGVNPAHPTRNGGAVESAFVHGAKVSTPNNKLGTPGYKSGSAGCIVGYGFAPGLGKALSKSPTGGKGKLLILR